MTDSTRTYEGGPSQGQDSPDNIAQQASKESAELASTARQEGRQVANTAAESARELADEARGQVSQVTHDASAQARQLAAEAAGKVSEQANQQTERMANTLRQTGSRLQAMAEGRPEEAGPIPDYLRQAGTSINDVAGRMQERGIDGLAHDVQTFARRRPGTFLLGAAVAGFAAGRFLRGAKDSNGSANHSRPTQPGAQQPSGKTAEAEMMDLTVGNESISGRQ